MRAFIRQITNNFCK